MRLIFLDFDGVLNWSKCMWRWDGTKNFKLKEGERGGMFGLDPERVAMLTALVERTGAKVVISSTWRLHDDWRPALEQAGFDVDRHVIGITPHMPGRKRGHEVARWFRECVRHGVELHEDSAYACIDDDSDFFARQPLFKTSWETGLTQKICNAVADHLIGTTDPV